MHMTEVETHKARKAHRCEWCWQRIDEGTEYKRYRYYDGGDAATIKMHPECMEAMQEEAAYWGGDFEWTPGQERPKVGADETANSAWSWAARNTPISQPPVRLTDDRRQLQLHKGIIMKYRLVQSIDGQMIKTEGDIDNAIVAFDVRGYALRGFNHNPHQRAELHGKPTFIGLVGPMWDGDAIRYEDPETYAALST